MSFLNNGRNRLGNRVISSLLVALFLLAAPAVDGKYGKLADGSLVALASSTSDKKKAAQEGLSDVQQEIEDIRDHQNEVAGQMDDTEEKLTRLFAQQEELKVRISDTQARVDQANLDLAAAEQKRDEEYESMKLRIQFMYENNTDDSFWTAILESDGISDMLNRIEYISDVYQSDRELMDAYEQSVQKVEELMAQLAAEMDELYGLQESFLGQQAELEELMASLSAQSQKYAKQLAEAEQMAESYKQTIAKAEEEERRRQQEAEAERRRQEQLAQQQQQQQQQQNSTGTEEPSEDPGYTSNISGQEVVNYALQFVGNPYVWGGNSLTKGCDCSGFVNLVFAHFGISMPRYSMAFANVGKSVSRSNIKAGDIVVYEPIGGVGHVAIYIGNGCIVEAQSSKAGITSYRSVDCRKITAIRRVL